MASRGVKVDGLGDLRKALRRAASDVEDLRDVHRAVGNLVVREGVQLVPRLTGMLMGTIRAIESKSAATVRAGTTSVDWAAVQHFGWPGHNIEPVPYLFDALDRRRRQVIDTYEDAVRRITARV